MALPDWESILPKGRRVDLVFDSDIMEKAPVHAALTRLKAFLGHRGADVWVIPQCSKVGGAKISGRVSDPSVVT